MKNRTVVTLCCCAALLFSIKSATAANNDITWVSPTILDLKQAHNLCPLIKKSANAFIKETNQAIKEKLTTVEPSLYQWSFDINGRHYLAVQHSSSMYCGSRGCSTYLYALNGNDCSEINFPNIDLEDIGIKNNYFYFKGDRCGIWLLTDKLRHMINLPHCDDDKDWDISTIKTFGDYTVVQSYPQGSGSYVGKMAYVEVTATRKILTFEANEATGWLTYDVDGKDAKLIVDNNFISDSQLDINVMSIIKNAHKMSVVVDNKIYDVSTKGSGATMIYLNEFPRWVERLK
ncbi:hypothetical protein AYY19_06210 [Photobacterium aquimaris]|uniref:Uncharacterized protein n=1 Tax=Photobacterium aquimaris TaxID=512643 RepID=A0A2T3IM48_9GAMM|nr:hypothetical protein [Photobacterium aquimaris]OBU14323.1 hypothetical protein AYY19_06210 [Photobacterium aquimaris]OBU19167.1 hypothetical protein AYY20_04185 [Photobacterium aquimaris]PSU29414.1 hypothetical protein CTM88_08115 [Photobacterium aquimaris]PSW01277.1 hypothetical protein CTM91_08920 [Photobacterium aquimaris]